jgi:hypothetical protein
MHARLDLHGNIPTFIRITDGQVHDVNLLDEIMLSRAHSTCRIAATSARKRLELDASLQQILQNLSVSLFEKTSISCALQAIDIPSASAFWPCGRAINRERRLKTRGLRGSLRSACQVLDPNTPNYQELSRTRES